MPGRVTGRVRMSNVGRFEFILLLIVLIVGLELAARRLRLPRPPPLCWGHRDCPCARRACDWHRP
ncbi:hypothetical protein RAA17_11260 [Komagataeibacter rhaeticus]|nr:hypothetical protein [Komagataeibacter rhaeticus]